MINPGESPRETHTVFVNRERPADDLPISQEFWDEAKRYSAGGQGFCERAFDAVVALERRVIEIETRLGAAE